MKQFWWKIKGFLLSWKKKKNIKTKNSSSKSWDQAQTKLDQKKYSLNRNKINFKSPTDKFTCILRNWVSRTPGHGLMRMDAWRRTPGFWPGGNNFKKGHFPVFKCLTKLSTETESCSVLLQRSKIRRMCRILRRQVRFHKRKKILVVHGTWKWKALHCNLINWGGHLCAGFPPGTRGVKWKSSSNL